MFSVKQVVRKSLNSLGLDLHRIPRVIDISNNYTRMLNDVNAGMCVPGHLYHFDYAIKHLRSDAPIIEIGLWAGLSTNLLTYFKRKHRRQNRIINCDRWGGEDSVSDGVPVGDSGVTFGDVRKHLRESYVRNVERFSAGALPHTFELLSGELFDAWRRSERRADIFGREVQLGGPVSFAFIDGGHDYDNVHGDFEMCDEFLERGGFILFDDSAPGYGFEDVQQVVSEVLGDPRYELVSANPHHLFRKR